MTTAPVWLVLGVLGVQKTCRGTCVRCWSQSERYIMLFYFAEGDFILNLCSVSSLQCSGRRNWTAARDLQRYRNHYPVRVLGLLLSTPAAGTLPGFGSTFLPLLSRLSTFQGFICEGEGMMCMWVRQKQAATFQSTFWGFSLKCVGNVRESKEKYCLLKGCCLFISCSHFQDLKEPENEEDEQMWNLSFYKNEIAFVPHGECLVWWLLYAIRCSWVMKD